MHIKVRLFASFREATGQSELSLEVAGPATVADVWSNLRQEYPRLGRLSYKPTAAINMEYARFDSALREDDEVAFLPPVSGGGENHVQNR
ncbi:MAG: MoaD/ThiS family protein [Chloroflexi bacterium]|nr:MoaD/ThiS family protein [Chloroflexota bacterium]